jgi:phosphonate transport system ATP-binding protein
VSAVELQGVDLAAAAGTAALVLRGLSLRIEAGEQVAVIGSSGAGKTTLLMALAAALPPRQGRLHLLGSEPWSLSAAARQRLRARLFLAPQQPPLPPRQRVVTAVLAGRLPQLGLWASLREWWHPRQAGLAFEALQALGVGDKLWQRVDRLSGGERQRVGLARALVSQAELWLVDEPLAALDPRSAEQVIDALCTAARQQQRTLVCSLHQVAVARERFARVLALREGALVYDGPGAALDDERLRSLYGQTPLDDPTPVPVMAPPPSAPLPQAMCR